MWTDFEPEYPRLKSSAIRVSFPNRTLGSGRAGLTAVAVRQLVACTPAAATAHLEVPVAWADSLGAASEETLVGLDGPIIVDGFGSQRAVGQVSEASAANVVVDVGVGTEAIRKDGMLEFPREQIPVCAIPQGKHNLGLCLVGLCLVKIRVVKAVVNGSRLVRKGTLLRFGLFESHQLSNGCPATAPRTQRREVSDDNMFF